MPSPNAHRELAQHRKASKMVSCIWVRLTPEQKRSPALPGLVAAFTAEQRLVVAKESGAHAESRPADLPPSVETWAKVVDALAEFVRMATEAAA